MKGYTSLLLRCCSIAAGCVALLLLLNALIPLPPQKPYSLMVEDRAGGLLHAFLASDGTWRLRTTPEEIPIRLKHILLQKEDRYFYDHAGINPAAMLRAALQNIVHGRRVSGASTITMQVARMMEPKPRTYTNKLIEVFRAFQLELRYSKDEILEMYLSMIPLGGNVEGLKSAAYVYYQTPLERLNIAQLLDLILIPNDPNGLRPDRNPARLFAERTGRTLPWIRSGLLSGRDALIIRETPAGAARATLPNLAPHFCLRVEERYGGSAVVRSSLDLRLQKVTEKLLSDELQLWRQKGVQNGAVLVVKNATREIVAYVGSEDFADAAAQGQVDAVKALRSPGSTLKPLLYAYLMERGDLTPKTRLLDVPYDAEGFTAENYDGTFSGLVYADEALRRSLNVPMIRLLKAAGVKPFLAFLQTAGIASLQFQKEKLGLSMITGGCGVTLEELVGAYAAFPNGGSYLEPTYLRQRGAPPGADLPRLYSPSTAFMVTDILSGLDRPDIPNNFESSLNLPVVAFKTGTSYGRRDAWAVGYSSEYTVGVWIGNVTNKGAADLVGSKAAAPLLVDILNSISAAHEKQILRRPPDLLKREVCATSGCLPNPRCTHLIEDDYSVLHTQERVCDIDKEYMISSDGKVQYCPSCVGGRSYRLETYENYPPELLSFWKTVGKTPASPPPHDRECTAVYGGEGPHILSPSEGMTYYLFSRNEKLVLQAASPVEIGQHNWYVDDRFLERSKPNEKRFVSFSDGEHIISCVDDRGRLSSVKITVKLVL